MGIDINAVMDHKLSREELHRLPELLQREWEAPKGMFHSMVGAPEAMPEWCWDLQAPFTKAADELDSRKSAYFFTPTGLDLESGFSGCASYHTICMAFFLRWSTFLRESTVQARARLMARRIGKLVGATTVLYVPDSGYRSGLAVTLMRQGRKMAEIQAWLTRECGPPAREVVVPIQVEGGREGERYYVESLTPGTEQLAAPEEAGR